MTMMKGLNLEKVLEREKRHSEKKKEDEVLAGFRQLLKDDDAQDELVLVNIFGSGGSIARLKARSLDPGRIYSLQQIRKICINYRLRFLDSVHYKGEIPYEAISHIKSLQRNQDIELKDFKIVAPAHMFNLRYKDKDPLLFVPLGNDRFYLVHKWGSDLHPLRRLLVFPFRNFPSLLTCVLLLAFIIMISLPDAVYMVPEGHSSLGVRGIFFFYLFFAFSGLTALYGFSRMKNFNSVLWNSKYMD